MKPHFIKYPFYSLIIFLIVILLFNFLIVDNISRWLSLSFHKGSALNFGIFISGVIIAPLLEEILFRFPLRKSRYTVILLFIPIALCFLVFRYYFSNLLFIPILIFSYAVFLFTKNRKTLEFVYENNKFFWWTINPLIFSICHIFYLDNESIGMAHKILVLFISYIPISILAIFLRIKFGILYAILLHSALNFCSLIINHLLYH